MTRNNLRLAANGFAAFAAALAFVVTAAAQNITPTEQTIVDYIDKNAAAAVAFLEKSVNIESPTEDIAGVKADGMLLKKEFESLGMTVRWIDMPASAKRAGHLIATTNGTKGKRILLLGHLDTVLRGEKFRRDGDRGFGTGIGDMKGGNVVILQALKALHAAGALKDSRITEMLTGDEEDACEPISLCRGDMMAAAKQSDAALSFEGSVNGTATVGRRGVSSWTVEVEAKTGHSSAIFRESMGNGAILEAARILDEMRRTLAGEKYLTFNPGLILGGTTVEQTATAGSATGKTNVVAAKVFISGDMRYISRQQEESIRARMSEIVSKSLPGTKATITFQNGIPAMAPVEVNYELLRQFDDRFDVRHHRAARDVDPDLEVALHLLSGERLNVREMEGPRAGKSHVRGVEP